MSLAEETLLLEPVRSVDPYFAWRMNVPASLQRGLSGFFERLISAGRSGRMEATLWLDTKRLHEDGGSRLFSQNASAWSPEMGFCFDPLARPPRTMELSDLMDADYGTPPPIDDRSAIFVSNVAATAHACTQVAGRGLATLIFFRAGTPTEARQAAEVYKRHTCDELRSCMAPGQFQNFPFYLPLLGSTAPSSATRAQLESWLGDAVLYVRDCAEGDEVVLVAREGYRTLFEAAGLRPSHPLEEETGWTWPMNARHDER